MNKLFSIYKIILFKKKLAEYSHKQLMYKFYKYLNFNLHKNIFIYQLKYLFIISKKHSSFDFIDSPIRKLSKCLGKLS